MENSIKIQYKPNKNPFEEVLNKLTELQNELHRYELTLSTNK